MATSLAPQSKNSASIALALLVLINLFNYIDRQVLAAVEPEIRGDLLTGSTDRQAKFWMGLLSTAFFVSYMLIAPLFGLMADRMSRWKLVGFGVILWSLASGASGVDWGAGIGILTPYVLLILTRCFVGVGEAAYGPVAPAMIADLYPVEKRGKVMAWFYLAIPVGGALGYAVGEVVKNALDWHWAFFSVVPWGVALGIWCFCMRDPPRGQADHVGETLRKPSLSDYLFLMRIPSYTFCTLGMTMMTFAIGGLAYWMPEFLEFHGAGNVGPLGPRTFFGGITAVAGLISTMAGGMVGDWLRPRFSGSYFLVSGCALALGFPMVLLMVWTSHPWTPISWVLVFVAVFLLFFNTGPTNTVLANVTHPSMRASAFALNILVIHALGDVISPPLIGLIADEANIDVAFSVVSVAMLLGGVFWLLGIKHLKADTEAAPLRLPT